jgi:hypothetical protein
LAEAKRLGGDHLEQVPPLFLSKRVLAGEQRLRGAVDRRHRRPQLVRNRRDQVALLLVEGPLGGQVAKGVDDAREPLDGHEREPEIPAADRDRERRRACGLPVLGDRDQRDQGAPVGERLGHGAIDDLRDRSSRDQRAARFQKRIVPSGSTRKIPSPTASATLAARSRSAATARAVCSAASSRRRSHHRRARRRRSFVRQLPEGPLALDGVERPARLLHDLRDVVEHDRLSARDHPALHPARPCVQLQGREGRDVEPRPGRPAVLGPDQPVALVVGRDDDTVVRDDPLEQLVEAVVDALVVERVSEHAGSVEQQLGDSGLPLAILGADAGR